MKSFSIVVAVDEKNGIGKKGGLAWHLTADIKYFKSITTKTKDPMKQNAVIMGRKTWDSLPDKFKPLPGRLNVVISQNSNLVLPQHVLLFSNLQKALEDLLAYQYIETVFIIGGAQIYTQALKDFQSQCDVLYVTHVKGDFNCDAFFPSIPSSFQRKEESFWFTEENIHYCFCQYKKSS